MNRGAGAASPTGPTLDAMVREALAEDVGDGDRTTEWCVPEGTTGEARVIAKSGGVVAGREPARRTFASLDPALEQSWLKGDGEPVEVGEAVLELRGSLRAILTGERTALNFLGRLSGIATVTARFVAAVEGTGARIADTRKTTPGWRRLEKRATALGGAVNHRLGLYDMVLLKENHLRAAGGIAAALRAVRKPAEAEGLAVEVEVRTLSELEEALREGADRLLLDNMTPAELREAVRLVRAGREPWPTLEASGGVTLQSVREVAETGVDLISVGAITHSAPALDLSLLVNR